MLKSWAYEILETAQIPLSLFYLALGLDFGLGLGHVNSPAGAPHRVTKYKSK